MPDPRCQIPDHYAWLKCVPSSLAKQATFNYCKVALPSILHIATVSSYLLPFFIISFFVIIFFFSAILWRPSRLLPRPTQVFCSMAYLVPCYAFSAFRSLKSGIFTTIHLFLCLLSLSACWQLRCRTIGYCGDLLFPSRVPDIVTFHLVLGFCVLFMRLLCAIRLVL